MRVKLTTLVLASLLLTGCSFGAPNPQVAVVAGELGAMPGVVSAEGEWTPGSLNFRAHSSIFVELEPEVTAEQLGAVTDHWRENADFDKAGSSLSLGFAATPSVTLSIDDTEADVAQLDAVLPIWLDLAGSFDVASVSVGSNGPDFFLRSSAMNSPAEAATTVAQLEESGGSELGASTWFIGPTTAEGDSNDEVGVSITSAHGLPDATALDYLAGFDSAFLSAGFDGPVFLGFEDLDAGVYRLAVKLAPESLRDTPSNQLEDIVASTPTWQSALGLARVVQPTDTVSISFGLYRNKAFALLAPQDCGASRESTALGDQLWQAWLGFETTPDGATAHSCG